MKIHIVQRNDTFQSIAEKYNVSVQDLIGMNTHINHLTGLVPGLKVKVPSPARKEESNVAQHIQKYYPNLDTSPIELKTVTTVEPEPVVVKQEAPIVQQVQQPTPTQVTKVKEEAIPVPLKPIQTEVPIQPNDGVKVGIGGVAASVEQYNVSVNQKNYQQSNQTTAQTQTQGVAAQPLPYPLPLTPSMLYSPYKPSCSSGPMPYPAPYANPYAVGPYVNPYPVSYGTPYELEIKKDGEWHEINVELFFTMPLMSLKPGESKNLEFNWAESYGKLAKGEYRIIKSVTVESDNPESFYVAAEFTITE